MENCLGMCICIRLNLRLAAEANRWNLAADIFVTLSEDQHLNFESIKISLELNFGEKCVQEISCQKLKSCFQNQGETLQELATYVERLTFLAYPDYPAEVRKHFFFQYFIDETRDPDIQKALRLADFQDIKSALV